MDNIIIPNIFWQELPSVITTNGDIVLWSTLVSALNSMEIKRAVHCDFPLSQSERFYRGALEELKIPALSLDPYNLTATAKIIAQFKTETLITVSSLAIKLLLALEKIKEGLVDLKLLYLFREPLSEDVRVFIKKTVPHMLVLNEVSLVPPEPQFFQCKYLAEFDSVFYHHLSPSLAGYSLPLFSEKVERICSCGLKDAVRLL